MKHIKLTQLEQEHITNNIIKQLAEAKMIDNVTIKLPALKNTIKPQVIIPLEIYNKMQALVKKGDKELAWHCTVDRLTENTFRLDGIYVFPQKVTGTSVDVDAAEYMTWIMNLGPDIVNKMRFHGHSHVNMGVFSSGTDSAYQLDMLEQVQDYYIYGIFNKKQDVFLCLYDVENNLYYDNKEVTLVIEDSLEDWAEEQIKEHVAVPAPVQRTVNAAYGYGWKQYATYYDDSETAEYEQDKTYKLLADIRAEAAKLTKKEKKKHGSK